MEQKEINELLERAKEEYYNESYSSASEIYEKILQEAKTDPEKTNGEALIYFIFCLMRSVSATKSISDFVGQDNIEQFAKYITQICFGLDTIQNKLGKDNREYIDSWLNIYKDFIDVIIFCHNNASLYLQEASNLYTKTVDKMMSMGGQLNYQQIQQLKNIERDYHKNYEITNNNYVIATVLLIGFNNLLVSHIIEKIEDYSLISSKEVQEIFDSVGKIYHLDDSKGIHNEEIRKNTQGLLSAILGKRNQAKSFEIERYWKDKPERKKELEDIKDKYFNEQYEIRIDVTKLEKEIDKICEERNQKIQIEKSNINLAKEKLLNEQKELINEKNALGLLKIKEKSILQDKINQKQAEINNTDTVFENKKQNIINEYQPMIDSKQEKIKELEKNIEQLEQKQKEIDKELNLEED